MREKLRYLMSRKSFHVCVMIVIISIIIFTFGLFILKYSVEGETNMPFNITKITIISSSEGIDKESAENKWAFDINQNNDIFIYVDKNENYGKEEAIENISIENINIQSQSDKGITNIYKPNSLDNENIFRNIQENLVEKIEYKGTMKSSLKNSEISNQGGIIAFRYAKDKIAEYFSNEETVNHNELLKKVNITEDELEAKISFDIIINTQLGKGYKANVSLNMPTEGILENGKAYIEITKLEEIIFKRIKN